MVRPMSTVPMIGTAFGVDTARVRRSDPETSHEAADTSDVEASIGAVLDTLAQYGPMSDSVLHFLMVSLGYRYTDTRVRTARAALVKLGKVEHTGVYGQTVSGRRTRIWAVS
jgi:hypothetical protein